jgi:outer membrane protein assembly factor BamD
MQSRFSSSFNGSKSALVAIVLVSALHLSACSSTASQDDQKTWPADKLYQSAKSDINVGNFDAAIKTLASLEARFPFGAYAQQAQLDTAYVKYKQNELADALVAVDRFMRLYPNHQATDYAMYLKGLINFNENQGFFVRVGNQDLSERDMKAARDGFDNFKELVTRFPQSRYAPDARLRMNYLVNNIAAGEVHVARYYFRRGAYVAAANRAKEVVRGYSDAPAIEEALAILWRSYEQLGIADLAGDAQRVLKTNYPKSDYLTAAIIQDDRRWWQIWR